MTQEDFAERTGVGQNCLSMMERGKVRDWGGDFASDQSHGELLIRERNLSP